MNFEYIKKYYKVPAEIGRRIKFYGKDATIVEDRGHYLGVNFDSHAPHIIMSIHPTDDVEYLDMAKPRKISKSKERYQQYLNSEVDETFAEWMGFRS